MQILGMKHLLGANGTKRLDQLTSDKMASYEYPHTLGRQAVKNGMLSLFRMRKNENTKGSLQTKTCRVTLLTCQAIKPLSNVAELITSHSIRMTAWQQ